MNYISKFLLFISFVAPITLLAQLPMYNMSDLTITECDGQLFDSDAGVSGNYTNNENYTFVINTGGTVTLNFTTFCTEAGYDSISFYDGTVATGTYLGSYSGSVVIPTIIATGGMLSINFVSDANANCFGWDAIWETTNVEPTPPELTAAIPACNTNLLDASLSLPVACSAIYGSAFTLTYDGGTPIGITGASPIGCSGGTTTDLQLTLATPIEISCEYILEFEVGVLDNCDSLWMFTQIDTFTVNTCPPLITITATEDTICPGQCTDILAEVEGCFTYTYAWNEGLPSTAGTHTVCPTTTTTYTVDVQDVGAIAPNAVESITITVLNPQVLNNDTTVCQSDPAFSLEAIPSGGTWSGSGIIDPVAGTFYPDSAGGGITYAHYTIGGVCSDSVQIQVDPIDAGPDEAACPFSPSFYVSGFLPAGGVWSGDSIAMDGLFTPGDTGVFTVTYTFGGCSDSKDIYVYNIGNLPTTTDTLCQNNAMLTLGVFPPAGTYSGPGIIDNINGVFDPATAPLGLNEIIYSLNGCEDTIYVYVKEINAGNNRSACPMQAPFFITSGTPAGGTWTGIGIIDPIGEYDPSLLTSGMNDQVIYTAPNSCPDTITIFVRQTTIVPDSLFYCEDHPEFELRWNTVQRYPGGGVWTGPGVTNVGSRYYFNAALAGTGTHTIYYDINTCIDSAIVIVYPTSMPAIDTSACTISTPWELGLLPEGAAWSGTGIINSQTGLFDPSVAGAGVHEIIYSSPAGCGDTVYIDIYEFVTASITGFDSVMCYTANPVNLTLQPFGGDIIGSGATISQFNASVAGEGTHELIYTHGMGECFTSDTVQILVHPPVQANLTAADSTICLNQSTTLSVDATGGIPDAIYNYSWNNGLFPINENTVSPTTTTSYVVTVWDGCSDPTSDTITINIHPTFSVDINVSELACYGDTGSLEVIPSPSGNYGYLWESSPPQTDSLAFVQAGLSYPLTVTNLLTNCTLDTIIFMPNYPVVTALFSTNPNLSCIPPEQSLVTFIDLSTNGDSGQWDINGIVSPYQLGINPQYDFTDAGNYDVTLSLVGEGGCDDEFSTSVCILEESRLFVPDVFSPNGDGNNDVLYARAVAWDEISFVVYNRLGEKVFETNNADTGWDGTHRGKIENTGVFVYYVSVKFLDGTSTEQNGTITLVK